MASRNYPPLNVRFWSKVDKHGPTLVYALGSCWLWTGAVDKDGYGQTCHNGVQCKAHRVAWFLTTGEWPKPFALHKCDNPSCVRFSHLFQGTPKDNTADMMKKKRAARMLGPWKTHCKLGHPRTLSNLNKNRACKLCIKEQHSTTKYKEVAKEYARVWRRKQWKQAVVKKTTTASK